MISDQTIKTQKIEDEVTDVNSSYGKRTLLKRGDQDSREQGSNNSELTKRQEDDTDSALRKGGFSSTMDRGFGSTQDDVPAEQQDNFKRQRTGNNQRTQYVPEEDVLNAQQEAALRLNLDAAKNLPIAKHRNTILKKLERNRVVVISGDTGCGKTTQVPQYILQQGAATNQEYNIICTQPRRLAASNIAKRVAMEMGERVGFKVGYQIGMDSRTSPETRIMFVTTGIFLMRLVNNPDSLQRYTHIIMDEVHERDLDIDFSLVVIKHLLAAQEQSGLQFKLILMSATFNVELFSNYFSRSSIASVETSVVYEGVQERYKKEEEDRAMKLKRDWGAAEPGVWDKLAKEKQALDDQKKSVEKSEGDDHDDDDEWVEEKEEKGARMPVRKASDPAEVVEINARPFKVTEFYIDQIIKNIKSQREQLGLTAQDKELIHEAYESFHSNKPSIKEGVMRVASILICDIIERQNTFKDDLTEDEKKGILIFLPGLHEIFEFIEFIKDFYPPQWVQNHLELIPLHSSLSQEEQDRAFRNAAFMKGRRKVIVATNIAESSITIPDIKYVIDFMLTKELYYDPVSKSESLQLHYSSKASAKQRAGRAGRVADGFVFRMCSQTFFDNGIPEYPKPEMQRCPLEKLILQVKLWGTYEPKHILGRAIQPPEFRDICNAVKNLQATGALTIAPPYADPETFKPKITALGKIFVNLPCDIRITRLFLFGMALKCMHQAIIMGCIHSQTRSIFRCNRNMDQINMTKLQCMYDERRDSDSIMLLRIYGEWQRRWHPELAYKEDRNNQTQEERERQRRFGGGRLRFRITPQERKWCSDKSLDANILRETASMVDEVKVRFMRMNIPEKCLNSRVRTGDDYPDGDLILKTCIGGAFYSRYIKAQYKNEDLLNRMKNTDLFDNDDHQRALILNKVSDYITEDHLKQFFETKFKQPVQSIQISVDKPMVIFSPGILESGFIKACFKLGTRNRQSRYKRIEDEEFERKQKFRSAIMCDGRKKAQEVYFSYDEIKEKLECEELRRPNFLYELRFETINGENYVDFDMDSINNFTYELDTQNINQVTFACQDFHDKGGRFLCRSGTRLPDVAMVDALFCLVFAPLVQVMANEEKTIFNKVICDGGELVINLTHVLTHHDLEVIQKMRTMLNETLCNEDNIKQAHMAQVDFYMKKLLSFQRLSLDIYTKLQALREEDDTDDRIALLKKFKDDKTGNEEENFFLEDELDNAKQGKGYEEINMDEDGNVDQMEALDQKANQDNEKGYFLQPIFAQKIDTKIYLYDDLVQKMNTEFRDRLEKKRKIINKMKHKCKELALKDATLLCDRCQQEVSLLKTLTYMSNDMHHAKCVFGHLKRVEIKDALKNVEGHYGSQDNKDFIEMYMEIFEEMKKTDNLKMEIKTPRSGFGKGGSKGLMRANDVEVNFEKYAFCECRNHHLVGIVIDQKYHFTDVSQLRLMFPQGHYEDWSSQWWSPGYREAFELQSKLNIKRAQESTRHGHNYHSSIQDRVKCELCNREFTDVDEFILHCNKDRTHNDLSRQFLDESYDIMFEQLDQRQAKIDAKKEECKVMRD